MSNISDTDSANKTSNSATKAVTGVFTNTHCSVCGSAFETPRMSKLYCSTRCKQFGYNHKGKIQQSLPVSDKGINAQPLAFFIDDFRAYEKKQKTLKRFWELEKRRLQWESIEQEIKSKDNIGLPISDRLWDSLTGKKLTQGEEDDLYETERILDENLMDLNLKELSLEQWSFLRSLHPSLNETGFLEVVSSLSRDFMEQLTMRGKSESGNSECLVIQNRFINHCNLIATGTIHFLKREETPIE